MPRENGSLQTLGRKPPDGQRGALFFLHAIVLGHVQVPGHPEVGDFHGERGSEGRRTDQIVAGPRNEAVSRREVPLFY
jgi:hypothetical protein